MIPPFLRPFLLGSKMVARAPVIAFTFQAAEWKKGQRAKDFTWTVFLRKAPRNRHRHIHVYLINWILVTWPHIDIGEARKCDLWSGHKNRRFSFYRRKNNRYCKTTNGRPEVVQAEYHRRLSGERLILSAGDLEGFRGEKTLLFCF